MTHRLRLREAARDEAREAGRWHETSRRGLGNDFLSALGAVMDQLAEGTMPRLVVHLPSRRPLRKVPLRRFPYATYFGYTTEEECVVWAVAHGKRRPGYWRNRV